ncbi:MAG: SusC/RagA family TonB-linked outer membrane protein [Carboxylicivirga sp.]|nr:SusC/RagA family TonB-linked outer membrane protein [Carboxylicivirga sp.]
MRISIVLLMTVFIPLSATTFSQNQKVAVKAKNITLQELFKTIQDQSDYDFFYQPDDIDQSIKVSFNGQQKEVNEILDVALKNTNLDYKIMDTDIVILNRDNKIETVRYQEKLVVKGVVTDENGDPLPGVNVFDKNDMTNGTISSVDGSYELTVNSVDVILKYSFIGFNDQEISVSGREVINVTLVSEATDLNEVVVTALGIRREQKALSYNVQKVSSEEINQVKSTNFMNSLVGRFAGVAINTSAAGPGGATKVVMRGPKSITRSNNALYVIDGIPMYNQMAGSGSSKWDDNGGSESIADINSDDIESVSMLTGAAAAALYGSQAANGVVLITTKRGKQGTIKVSVNNTTTFSNVYMLPEFQNTYGTLPGSFHSWGLKLDTPTDYDPKNFFETGVNLINSVSLSTGTEKNQTYISLSSTNSSGVIHNNEYNRYNLTARNTAKFAKDKLQLDLSFNLIKTDDNNPIAQGVYFNPIISAYLFPRGENFEDIKFYQRWDDTRSIYAQYWPYSDALATQNPYWETNSMVRKTNKDRYITNIALKWDIFDGINITGRVKVDNESRHHEREYNATTYSVLADPNGSYLTKIEELKSEYADAVLNINKNITEDIRITANIGASVNDVQFYIQQDALNLNIPNLFTTMNVAKNRTVSAYQDKWHDQTQSVFGSVEIGYKSMFYLTATGRNDWDSKLAFSNQASFFYPSLGLSTVVSEIIEMPKFISYAKVRASYAEVASPFDRYLSNPALDSDGKGGYKSQGTLAAKFLKPEETKSIEFGLNLKLWKALSIDATYYKSNTYNQTFRVEVPASLGADGAYIQAGDIQNEGLELALGYTKNLRPDLSVSTNLTYTMNRNKVKELLNGVVNPYTNKKIDKDELRVASLGGGMAPQIILREGGTMGDMYVEHHIRRDAGKVLVDGQGRIYTEEYTKDGKKDPRKIGSMLPDGNMGWSNNISYKGVDFGFVFAARFGGLVTSNTEAILDYYGVSKRSADARDAGGIPMNGDKISAKSYYQTIASGDGGLGQNYTYDATNIRLSQMSLSYALPKQWFNDKLNIRLGVVGNNLWMIYCKAPFDPELSAAAASTFYQGVDYFMMPSTRSFGGNIKIQF